MFKYFLYIFFIVYSSAIFSAPVKDEEQCTDDTDVRGTLFPDYPEKTETYNKEETIKETISILKTFKQKNPQKYNEIKKTFSNNLKIHNSLKIEQWVNNIYPKKHNQIILFPNNPDDYALIFILNKEYSGSYPSIEQYLSDKYELPPNLNYKTKSTLFYGIGAFFSWPSKNIYVGIDNPLFLNTADPNIQPIDNIKDFINTKANFTIAHEIAHAQAIELKFKSDSESEAFADNLAITFLSKYYNNDPQKIKYIYKIIYLLRKDDKEVLNIVTQFANLNNYNSIDYKNIIQYVYNNSRS